MRSGTITFYIDTSSSKLYAGLVQGESLLIEVKEYLGKDLSTNALYKIEEMFQKVNLTPRDVDKIMVVNGPGSFTGIRIGITIAKTFAWALKKEIIVINSLEAMAISLDSKTFKVPVIDARRGYVFAGIYDADNQIILKNQYVSLNALMSAADSLNAPYQIISNDSLEIEKVPYDPDILRIVLTNFDRESVNPHAVNPEYLKRTEAEESKGINAE